MAKPQTHLTFFSKEIDEEIDRAINYIVVKKCLRPSSVTVTVSVHDVARVLAEKHMLNSWNIGLRAQIGRRLSYFARKGLLKLIRESPYRKYKVTSKFFEAKFGFKYSTLKSKPLIYLSPVEITYLMLKEVEGGGSGFNKNF